MTMNGTSYRFASLLGAADEVQWLLSEYAGCNAVALSVRLVRGSPDVARVLRACELLVTTFPRLRQRVTERRTPVAVWGWERDPTFELQSHVEFTALRAPGTLEVLLGHAEAWVAEPLEPEAPPWKIRFVTGLPDGQTAVLLKTHHVLGDAGVLLPMVATLFGTGSSSSAARVLTEDIGDLSREDLLLAALAVAQYSNSFNGWGPRLAYGQLAGIAEGLATFRHQSKHGVQQPEDEAAVSTSSCSP
jgi:hypothetical protein